MNDEPWFKLPAMCTNPPTAALVVGAGLAGCCTARALAERGWEITVLEQGDQVASGASGNRSALLRPHATRDSSTPQQFFTDAYETSLALFANLKEVEKQQKETVKDTDKFFFHQTGALQLSNNTQGYRESKHLQSVSKEMASSLCGIDLPTGGLYFPTAGSVDIAAACRALLNHPDITLQCEFTVQELLRKEDCWHVTDGNKMFKAPIIVLANGATLGDFHFTQELTITATRGQTTLVDPGSLTSPEIPICGKHYLIPQRRTDSQVNHKQMDYWTIGASFDRSSDKSEVTPADDDQNLQGIDALLAFSSISSGGQVQRQPSGQLQIIDSWAAVRATTPDRLPIVGALSDPDFYRNRYADIRHGKAASSYPDAEYLSGLYVNGGYGSRGLCVSALCSELLAAQITGETCGSGITNNPAIRDLYLQLLHPARFHIRRLKKSST